jgi:hypothetical protein
VGDSEKWFAGWMLGLNSSLWFRLGQRCQYPRLPEKQQTHCPAGPAGAWGGLLGEAVCLLDAEALLHPWPSDLDGGGVE